MKNEMLAYLDERIDWYQKEQVRLRSESCSDEATHMQIAVNVYNIFLSTYRAMKFDLTATTAKFRVISGVWEENERRAAAHNDADRQFIEELKISRAKEILAHAKELEETHHD